MGKDAQPIRTLRIANEVGWHSPALQRLLERPFRTLPGGILLKFLRRLSQFQLSFLAKSRWAPRSSGEFRSRQCHPAIKSSTTKNKKGTGRLQACPLNASPSSAPCSVTAQRTGDRCLLGTESSGHLPGRLNRGDFRKWLRPCTTRHRMVHDTFHPSQSVFIHL